MLAIITFLSVSAWITLEVYHAYTTSTVSEVDEQLIQPIDPKIDHNTVFELIEGQ